MPETVNGYELFQLCGGPDTDESVRFAVFENELGENGEDTSVMYGADTGRRMWRITLPPLSGASSQKSVTVGGVTMTRADYLWDLFCRTRISGEPIVLQSPRNDQYYLVKFVDKELTYKRMLTKLFSTGVSFRQWRRGNETVFDVAKMDGVWGWYKADAIEGVADGGSDFEWADQSGNGNDLFHGENATYQTNEQNGLPIVRLDGVDDFLTAFATPDVYEAFMIFKVRAATFANYSGILTANTTTAALVGNNGDTKMVDFSLGSAFNYRKNGVKYDANNQQAPMNEYGLVHIRFETGFTLANIQIGKDRDFAGRFAAIDIGEIVLFDELQPLSSSFELAEHLQKKWAI